MSKNSSPRLCHEFKQIWSLEPAPLASNLAKNVAHDVAVHHRDDRVRDQRSAATQARLCRRREAHPSRATRCRYGRQEVVVHRRAASAAGHGDPLFTEAFEAILGERGVKCVKIPARSPNCNPHAERYVQTIKYECLNHLVLFGERHLRHVIKEFMAHYHRERFHQGLGGQLIEKQATSTAPSGALRCRSRLGGILDYYYREAA